MTSNAIKNQPIVPIATWAVDEVLAEALLSSTASYYAQLRGRRIWVACSGGRDSLALAAVCVQLFHQGKLPFLPQILHVDHGLQADSTLWANHVANWVQAQQLLCTVLRAQVDGHDEQAARHARYQVMVEHINQGDVLMLAHHADDQAETVLMRLIQGAGVKGLAAMQPWRERSQGRHRYVLWRPWLSASRRSISEAAQRLSLPYIDDPTNDNGDNVRSSLRRDVMPLLVQYNANVVDNIARSASLLRDAQATIAEQAKQDLQHTAIHRLHHATAQRVLAIEPLHDLPEHRQRQLLHFWLAQDEPLPASKQLIDDMLVLTQRQNSDHQTQLNWYAQNQRYCVQRYRQQLFRLSHYWLAWLTIPLAEQSCTLSVKSIDANEEPMKIDIRRDAHYQWQLHIDLDKWLGLVDNENDMTLKISPLNRQQRLKPALTKRVQSGKKLYQALNIPIWMRESLIVVYLVSKNTEIPLLLLSPLDSWQLDSSNSLGIAINDKNRLSNTIFSKLL